MTEMFLCTVKLTRIFFIQQTIIINTINITILMLIIISMIIRISAYKKAKMSK